jgi:integrase
VLNLRWEQVDFIVGMITLLETKSGRPQSVTMNAPARQVLKVLEAHKASEWVLPSTSNAKRPLSGTVLETRGDGGASCGGVGAS